VAVAGLLPGAYGEVRSCPIHGFAGISVPVLPDDFEALAASVAHEMGTPLTVVNGALHLLRQDLAVRDGVGDALELLNTALRNVKLLELQLGRFRDLEGGGDLTLQRERIDLARLVRELLADLDHTLLARHETRSVVPDELIVEVDPARVRQLIYALLSNAAKYCPDGLTVVVTARQDVDEVVLEVRDQGNSVAPEDAERIFERYERRNEAVDGAGLGLYLARRYAQAHGGRLSLVPAPDDEGNTFEAHLPVPGHQRNDRG
jgi:signal transduction histidine kinase